jgi:hypothetical protein
MAPDGPLPPLLLPITLVIGLVDGERYVKWGPVFVVSGRPAAQA